MLPDDDGLGPNPRYKPPIDEVYASHLAEAGYLPPLSAAIATSLPVTRLAVMIGSSTTTSPPSASFNSPPPAVTTQLVTQVNTTSTIITQPPLDSVAMPVNSSLNPTQSTNNNAYGGSITNGICDQSATDANGRAFSGLSQADNDSDLNNDAVCKTTEHWIKSYWRPAMGWLYMIICFMDFVGFPLLSMFLPVIFKKDGLAIAYVAWQSITLSNGGLVHLAFGAILGVAAFSRGQEKLLAMR